MWIERVFNYKLFLTRISTLDFCNFLNNLKTISRVLTLVMTLIVLFYLWMHFYADSFDIVLKKLLMFINIWPVQQWISSVITLILMYWWIGSWYNKKLAKQGGWISWQVRVNMIMIDLFTNLSLGIYYMDTRDSVMGAIMLSCPIAVSPVIFLVEFIVFVWYYKKYVLNKKDRE